MTGRRWRSPRGSRQGRYGFTRSVAEEQWAPWNHRPWNDKQGRLSPNGGWSEIDDSDPWWEGLPGTLEAGSEGLPELPKPVIHSDGFHGDLTSLVEAELFGDGPRPDGFEVFGLYPTCGALVGRIDT